MEKIADIAQHYDVPVIVAEQALKNIVDKKVYLLAFSGKIGAGKDTIAPLVVDRLGIENSCHEFFAKPLKEEINTVIKIVRFSENFDEAVTSVSSQMGVGLKESQYIVNLIYNDVNTVPDITAYNKTVGVREALQYWGTEVRRNQDGEYWVKKAIKNVLELTAVGISVYMTDVRFPNEVGAVLDIGGLAVRLNVSPTEQDKRVWTRDNTVITDMARYHLSETALDDFPLFTITVDTDNTQPENIADKIIGSIQ